MKAASRGNRVPVLWDEPPGQTGIVELLRAEHQRILLLEAQLQAARCRPGDAGSRDLLARRWERLAVLLATHADALEEVCCLPMFGTAPPALDLMRSAVADLDDIREAVLETCLQTVGGRLSSRRFPPARSIARVRDLTAQPQPGSHLRVIDGTSGAILCACGLCGAPR